ncbi:hypothetical protein [Cylindrospermopsis curvispora]|nr:hypothetical protein [Cylindrospermopsis curvispora]
MVSKLGNTQNHQPHLAQKETLLLPGDRIPVFLKATPSLQDNT